MRSVAGGTRVVEGLAGRDRDPALFAPVAGCEKIDFNRDHHRLRCVMREYQRLTVKVCHQEGIARHSPLHRSLLPRPAVSRRFAKLPEVVRRKRPDARKLDPLVKARRAGKTK